MSLVDLSQDSTEWLTWRKRGLGSSDAPVLAGVSPWRTITQLWEEKVGVGKPQKTNKAMERGKRLEEIARAIYESEYGVRMLPATMVHDEIDFIRGSLDGWNGLYGIEIKCPMNRAGIEAGMRGEVPEKYYPQLQWLMLVSGSDYMDYITFDGQRSIEVSRVEKNIRYQRNLVRLARWFWHKVEERIPVVHYDVVLSMPRKRQEVF